MYLVGLPRFELGLRAPKARVLAVDTTARCPREESNLDSRFRKPVSYPLNDEGARAHSRYIKDCHHFNCNVNRKRIS